MTPVKRSPGRRDAPVHDALARGARGRGALAAALVASLAAACSSSAPSSDVPIHPAGEHVVYVALGASDSLGFGTNDPIRQAWPQLFFTSSLPGGATFINMGIAGATAADAVADELPYAVGLHPTLVTVFLGVNDLIQQIPVSSYERSLGAALDGLRASTPRPMILIANIPPLDHLPAYLACRPNPPTDSPPCSFSGVVPPPAVLNARVAAYNGAVASVAAQDGATLVDLYAAGLAARANRTETSLVSDDGFHPSPAGHRLIARVFAQAYRSVAGPAQASA
jgi:lysophospholipase L1-like esterase